MSWIKFEEAAAPPRNVTRLWQVVTIASGVVLGEVRWNTGWRAYAFFPAERTLFEQDCLRELAGFVEERTREHKAAERVLGKPRRKAVAP